VNPVRALAWGFLYASALLSLALESGRFARAAAPAFGALPARAGPLTLLEELHFDLAALGAEPPEAFSYRAVRDEAGRSGKLFMAYYARAQRWSGRPHDLEACYAAAGWSEHEATRLDEPHRPWSRRFERALEGGGSEAVRVVHWLERPGPDEDRLAPRELLRRLLSGSGLRPDVVSAYLEFPADAAPDAADAARAVAALSSALEANWE
jgi:hypothetical protein